MVRTLQQIIRLAIGGILVVPAVFIYLSVEVSAAPIYRTIDGDGNNIANPGYGMAGIQLLRQGLPAAYDDGISAPRGGATLPSARAVSNAVSAQTGQALNAKRLTDMFWQWGQFVDHDIDLTLTNHAEPLPIPLPANEPLFSSPIPFSRSVFDPSTGNDASNPRQQVNSITAFIDGSNVYGSDPTTAAMLRSFSGGRLRTLDTPDGALLPLVSGNAAYTPGDMFFAGDVRANEQSGLTAMHTLFMREHNRIADMIATDNPTFDDEKIYQEARKIVGAQIQAITYNEFLPLMLGPSALGSYDPQTGYDASVDPGIANAFSTAAYRFGHSMLSESLLRLDENGDVIPAGNLPLQNAFFNPAEIVNNGGIEPLLRGLAAQTAEDIDLLVIDDVRNLLFGPPAGGVGLDLAALNIQRGRDHGLPGYNETRALLLGAGSAYTGWDDPDIDFLPGMKEALMTVYADIDDIDLWVGGLAEIHFNGGIMGELFSVILVDQFERLRAGDRFWYQNDGLFEDVWMEYIEGSTLSHIITSNTGISSIQSIAMYKDIPEPGTLALFGLGLAGIGFARRKRMIQSD